MTISNASPIGFVGTGSMGGAVAMRWLAGGQRLCILAGPRRSNTDALVQAGAREAGSAEEVGACDLVVTCLPSSEVVERVSRDVILPAVRPGSIHLDLTTGDPRVGMDLARAYEARGAHYVDGAILGAPEQAVAGELTIMLGAASELAERLRTPLAAVARRVLPMGPTGAAHRARLIMGFIGMATAAASAEALVAATHAGIALPTFAELLGETGMTSSTFQAMAAAAIDGDEARRKLSLGNAAENTRCLAALMEDLGVAAPVARATAQTFREAVAQGHADAFVPALTRLKRGTPA
ncbi:NAD(P)-binding domain-containing protein [uncultured Alsobacter sp.]|uniref:NAD(P)-dependent oxidoreductase n=1 Tax=uncultured Alsobacter sp. TaxID=1748258 RepID=UPI0025EAC592|nr:NAD(P)-binding domain-containing protein [uncultured Alsobacter sp.]